MFKRTLSLLCVAVLVLGLITASASETEFPIFVNGVEVGDAYAVVNDGVTYVSAYHVALALRPETQISWAYGKTILAGSDFALTLRAGDSYFICNDRYFYLPDGVQSHSAHSSILLVPVRVLASALGAEVGWSVDGVTLTPSGAACAPGKSAVTSAEDIDLLARVIAHESRNEPLAGKIAVANVILNRVADSRFPATISGVLSQKNQFPGATNATATVESILAAKLALDGANTAGGACWFNGAGKTCWASQNKALIVTIGGHAFYG